MPGPAAAMVGASLAGGAMQASAAKKAAKAQQAAADQQIAYQEETRDIVRSDLAPYREGGDLAYGAMQNMLGLGAAPVIGGTAPQIETISTPATAASGYWRDPIGERGDRRWIPTAPATEATTSYRVNGQTFSTMDEAQAYADANKTGGTEWSWQTDPGYEFRLGEGLGAIEGSAAARGGLYSGATMRDLQKYGQDYASQEFGNVYSRLAGVADAGLNAAQMSGNASMQAAGNVGNALGAAGNAQAAGYIGQGNAWNNGIGNALGMWNYQNQMGGNTGSGTGAGANSFWGNLWG